MRREGTAAARTTSVRYHPHRGPGPAAGLGLAVLALWWTVTRAGLILPVFLPDPLDVARRLWLGVSRGGLLGYTRITLIEAALGCLAATALSLPLAWALFHWRSFSRAVLPYVAASQAVPAIAIAPLLVVWIGYGTVPTVVLCVLMVFFPITVTVLLGLRGLDTDIIDAARLDGAHGTSMIVHMELPMALPAIISGLRTGFTLSVTGAVIGEMTMGGRGLGMVLASQRQSVDTTGLFSTIVVLCVMATSIHWCLYELERRSRVVNSMRGRRAT
jgi:hydroxymethylpyrimidine ABC superfamily ATP binding cassette transporter, membrane protein